MMKYLFASSSSTIPTMLCGATLIFHHCQTDKCLENWLQYFLYAVFSCRFPFLQLFWPLESN